MSDYNTMELMISVAARNLEDGASVAVGTGAPCAAAMLAQKAHSPNLVIIFEAGGIAPLLPTMPISVGDSRTFYKAVMASGMCEVMETLARGMVDYCFLGGAQIDMYGNINSTVIGDWEKPKVRFPGSGGANDFGSMAWKIMVITPQDSRRFVERVSFITTPGYLDGPGAREKAGLAVNTGPHKVITNMAVMGFDPESKRMRAESIHKGFSFDDVQENTGFELLKSPDLVETPEPTADELRLLREEVDPNRYIIGR
ncbi:MAG: 3-oxoacid CoA-transferase [Actinomycetota bacterium]|nr:3-oxoacid CoA-transferase [Actinomycetota bacterium]MDD5667346.1 3-oxoacid CoA-transferase [Actinomycetota bacterium]